MPPGFRVVLISISVFSVSQGKENPGLPPYRWPDSPKYNLRLDHQPLKEWKIETVSRGKGEVILKETGRAAKARGVKSKDNPAAKGKDENLYLLHFDYGDYLRQGGPPIREMESNPQRPVFLGWDYHDFSARFHRRTGERGLSRKYIVPSEFSGLNSVPLDVPRFRVDLHSPDSDWQRFLLPVVTAEGGGDYLVINGFDKAGMTVGFIQMAAHTPNDMIAMMRHLIQNDELQRDPYANPERWFPELGITSDGKLGYRNGDRIISLEERSHRRNKNEGFKKGASWAYFREDFVRFCNPCVRVVNLAELEFAARWLMWSMSPKMRHAQLKPTKDNVVQTLQRLDGVPEKISAADAAVAAVILHWRDGAQYRKIVTRLLKEDDPVRTFLNLESRKSSLLKQTSWIKASTSDRKILNQRVAAVRSVFERDPSLLARLNELEFDFETGTLIAKAK